MAAISHVAGKPHKHRPLCPIHPPTAAWGGRYAASRASCMVASPRPSSMRALAACCLR